MELFFLLAFHVAGGSGVFFCPSSPGLFWLLLFLKLGWMDGWMDGWLVAYWVLKVDVP